MRSKQYFTSIKNNPHEISTDPSLSLPVAVLIYEIERYDSVAFSLYMSKCLCQRSKKGSSFSSYCFLDFYLDFNSGEFNL